jgi:hypothetical protein
MPNFEAPQLDAGFYGRTPLLAHIYRLAAAHGIAPDSLLVTVLARVAACIPPGTRIESHLGMPLSLNFLVGLVAEPGIGKSLTWRVARQVVPSLYLPEGAKDSRILSSGQGIAEAYLGATVTEEGRPPYRPQVTPTVVFWQDEGASLFRLGKESTSILLETLRSGFSGSDLGGQNATHERNRYLEADHYRLVVCVGFQPSNAAELIRDDAEGTPHRFLWASARDRHMAEVAPSDPGPLDWRLPGTWPDRLPLDPDIRHLLRRRHVARHHGTATTGALDSHGDSIQMKLAGVLALFHGRLAVGPEDWILAEEIIANSRRVRDALLEYGRLRELERSEEFGKELAARRIAQDDETARHKLSRALDSIAKAVRKLHSNGERVGDGRLRNLTHLTRDMPTEDVLEAVRERGELERTPEGYWIPRRGTPHTRG